MPDFYKFVSFSRGFFQQACNGVRKLDLGGFRFVS
jgi:hypothetical protein